MAHSLSMRHGLLQAADAWLSVLRSGARASTTPLTQERAASSCRNIASQTLSSAKRGRMRAAPAGVTAPLASSLGLSQSRHASSSRLASKPNTAPTPSKEPSSDAPPPLPFLPRPLGVTTPPDTRSKTWQEMRADLMNQDLRREKRQALVKEATQGYFNDYHVIRADNEHRGKTWIAPSVLIREDRALYMPNISGSSLAARSQTVHTTDLCRGKVSIVAVLTTRISEEHANSFVADALADWEGKEGFTYVQINHQPNTLKSMMLTFSMSNIRRSIPENRWGSYMFAGGEWGGLKGPLGITNKHIGYVYLVDPNLKIRWAGCGFAEGSENEGLRRALGVLMGRWKEAQQQQARPSQKSV